MTIAITVPTVTWVATARPSPVMEVKGNRLRVAVWRGGAQGAFQEFEVPRRESQTVLDVVSYIQRELDPTLSYRFSCRVGMQTPAGIG